MRTANSGKEEEAAEEEGVSGLWYLRKAQIDGHCFGYVEKPAVSS